MVVLVVLRLVAPKVEPPIAGNMPDFDVERVAPLWVQGFGFSIPSFRKCCVQLASFEGTGSAAGP